jgi:hypothetical protein
MIETNVQISRFLNFTTSAVMEDKKMENVFEDENLLSYIFLNSII